MLSPNPKKVNTSDKSWLNLAKNLSSDFCPPSSACPESHRNVLHLSVPNATAKTFVISQMLTPLSKENMAFFWLCRDDKEAESIYENLKFWQVNSQISRQFQIRLLNPENLAELSIINYQLFNTPQTNQIIVASTDHLQHLDPHQPLIKIKQNQILNLQTLASQLSNFGYDRNAQADQPGAFAIRGDIIDIWTPQSNHPAKIELEYEKVVKISSGKHALSEIDVIPLKISKFKLSQINSNTSNDARDGKQFNHKVIESLNHATIITSDPDDRILTQFKETPKIVFESFLSKNNTQCSMVNDQWPAMSRVEWSMINPPLYHNNLNGFLADLKKFQNKKYQIILATDREKSLKQLFKEKGISNHQLSIINYQLSYLNGFQSPKIILLTDHEIFGRSKSKTLSERSKSKSKPEIKTPTKISNIKYPISNIQPGDFVVHEDHGIAVYRGISRQPIDNLNKEFFILQYKDNDKLYVPVELADKIDKYIGLANPPIHRLHGGMWYQIKRKIKEQAEKIAKELLDLYAQREIAQAPAFSPKTPEERELENSFPYEETPDQLKTIEEVENDLTQNKPADRLVCGDVGFGKTEVAIRAAFKAVMNNYQAVLLCPTTILAQQHFDTFSARLKNFPVNVAVLSRFKSQAVQNKIVNQTKAGLVDILIGTHRLLSKDIGFKNLGLIIIDEEQRFGVEHKEKLKKFRANAHVLTLTATPIPRTLNFALSGLRHISVIETPPPGRQKIETFIEQYSDERVKQALEKELARQGQIYFVHNQVETISFAAKKIQELVPQARVSIAHGQLPESELIQAMSELDTGKIDILVCSTIIENGLDLPNVNTLIVDNATKFGLAQLYQLRGRVGRSDRQAYAYFFYRRLEQPNISPYSREKMKAEVNNTVSPLIRGRTKEGVKDGLTPKELARQTVSPCPRGRIKEGEGVSGLTPRELARLQALKQAEELGSGFQLALRDLEIRGVGNILGKKQHGAVAAIGLSLYTRLLSNAVEELKTGVKLPDIPDISIDLPLEISIPSEVEPNEVKRLNLYQQLANITDLNELINIREKFACPPKRNLSPEILMKGGRRGAQRYSLNIREKSKNIRDNISEKYSQTISEKFNNLFHLLEIKLLAQQTNIASIDTSFGLSISGSRHKKINIKFKNNIDQTKFQKLLDRQPDWKQSNNQIKNQIKINLDDLGDGWIKKLKQAIMIFRK